MAEQIFHRLVLVSILIVPYFVKAEDRSKHAPAETQVVVWIQAASEKAMRLSRTEAPSLRDLARKGISFPKLGLVVRDTLTKHLRATGKELGKAYREISIGEPSKDDPLAKLISQLGKPSPVSEKEKKAFERLRAASEPTSDGSPAAKREKKPRAKTNAKRDRKTKPAERADQKVLKALATGARLVTLVDTLPANVEDKTRDRNFLISRIARATFSGWGGRGNPSHRSYLFVVLIPETGSPALLMAGHALKRGRFFNRELDSEDIVAGVKALLASSSKRRLEGLPDWLSEAHLSAAFAEKGGK